MYIAVQGSKEFDDYTVFMRSMAVGISMMNKEDKELYVYSVGPKNVNNFVAGFCNITERSLKSRGIKVRHSRVPISWAEENINQFDYFIFLSKPNEYKSRLTAQAELSGVEVGIFKF